MKKPPGTLGILSSRISWALFTNRRKNRSNKISDQTNVYAKPIFRTTISRKKRKEKEKGTKAIEANQSMLWGEGWVGASYKKTVCGILNKCKLLKLPMYSSKNRQNRFFFDYSFNFSNLWIKISQMVYFMILLVGVVVPLRYLLN